MKDLTQKTLRKVTGIIKMPDLSCLFPGQLRIRIGRAFHARMFGSSFSNHIVRIISLSAKKQMIWINAMANVASMKDAKTFGDRTAKKLPSYSRADSHESFTVLVGRYICVARNISRSFPKPTGFGLLGFFIKAFQDEFSFFHINPCKEQMSGQHNMYKFNCKGVTYVAGSSSK